MTGNPSQSLQILLGPPAFMGWTIASMLAAARSHPFPVLLTGALIFFMKLEYTVAMVKPGFQPRDVGFACTAKLHDVLMRSSATNSALAAANTAFVIFIVVYVIWIWLVEGRKRAVVAALFMYTCRGLLGYATRLPIPQEFLGSGLDFPLGNTSFFLFFSGHVAASVIISLDMKRMRRWHLAILVDSLNVLQSIRLLATRGHYTIDLLVGAGAGWVFDFLAGKYEEKKIKTDIIDGFDLIEKEGLAADV